MKRLLACLLVASGIATSLPVRINGDEGMWLFNSPPTSALKEKYGFEPTQEWLNHLMKASVRFNSGGSASFVSSNGLVLTNHHVAADTLYKLSTKDRNINEDGFLARSYGEEIKAPDLELNQLVGIEDVTDRVNAAISAEMTLEEAAQARQAVMAEIEKESLDATGFRSDVITLFGGARYHLYQYKKYTDVRLVWAPEASIAFFGGDADNFEYPRFCLDVTLFRVYEDGKPAKIDNFLVPDASGAKEDELIFVSGNPGRTRRIFTTAAVEYQRDISMPRTLNYLRRREVLLQQFGLQGEEQARIAKDDLTGVQNSRKALSGMLGGLLDPAFTQAKREQEESLKKHVESAPNLKGLSSAWEQIEQSQKVRKEWANYSGSFRSQIYNIAESIVLLSVEDTKPSPQRLRAFRDSNRESLLQSLYSDAPLYPEFEQAILADELARFVEDRGGNDPLVVAVLDGKSPQVRAEQLIAETKLFDVENRKALVASGNEAVRASADPLVKLALILEPEYRRLTAIQNQVDETERQAYTKITEAKFATAGETLYPDATFTLRLSYGQVKGYELGGKQILPHTTMGGTYQHEADHGSKEPWVLPKSWVNAKGKFDESVPFNFVCTADIIGGNSGSPVVSREGKLVGVIFDGNIQSLTSDLYYTDNVARAVSVHVGAMLEALRKVYDAEKLADEIGR